MQIRKELSVPRSRRRKAICNLHFNKKVTKGEHIGFGVKKEKKQTENRYSELKKIFSEYKDHQHEIQKGTPKYYERKEIKIMG
jgi:hypothetical protein